VPNEVLDCLRGLGGVQRDGPYLGFDLIEFYVAYLTVCIASNFVDVLGKFAVDFLPIFAP
jgi:hypothetical protein